MGFILSCGVRDKFTTCSILTPHVSHYSLSHYYITCINWFSSLRLSFSYLALVFTRIVFLSTPRKGQEVCLVEGLFLIHVANISAVQKTNSCARILHNKFQEDSKPPAPEKNATSQGSTDALLRARAVKKDPMLEGVPLKKKGVLLPAKSQVQKS